MKTLHVLVASLALFVGGVNAQNQPSDFLRITVPGSPPIVLTLIEGAVGLPETLIFNLPGLGPDGLYGGTLTPGFAAPIGAVALLEPLGEPITPGEPLIFWPTPGGQRILSDLVISVSTATGPGIVFISDGDANLAPWATYLLSGPSTVPAIDESGTYQDLTSYLLPVPAPYRVEVLSDVSAVPEPGAASLFIAGVAMLSALLRGRSRPGMPAHLTS